MKYWTPPTYAEVRIVESISDFINSITRDQSIAFLNEWNEHRDHRERIYISYDSTNKNSQAGDLDLVEVGHPKENVGAPIFNYSIAFDKTNSIPLFYEAYPGSVVDVSQLQLMLEKANGYGYKHIGFILDRGYFCKENIHFMDRCGYEFIIMMKGMKSLVKELVLEVKGSFEDHREYSIRNYRVSGITVKRKLYPSDERERYFHIYYNDRKKTTERENIESKIDQMSQFLQENEGRALSLGKPFRKYFDLIFFHEGQPDEKFMYGTERHAVIDEEISLCGYFVIITSEKMTAEEAIDLYKSRDASEKLFRGDKSYLGNKSLRVYSNDSLHAKIFIEFIRPPRKLNCHLKKSSKSGNIKSGVRKMDIYENAIKLNDKDFKEIIGVKRSTFDSMVNILKVASAAKPKKWRGGRKKKLSIEEQLILTLKYYRFYVTQKALAFEFGVGEATVCDTIKWVEETLIKDGTFSLPGKKKLLEDDSIEVILIDVTECPIERPQKNKENTTPEKRKDTQ